MIRFVRKLLRVRRPHGAGRKQPRGERPGKERQAAWGSRAVQADGWKENGDLGPGQPKKRTLPTTGEPGRGPRVRPTARPPRRFQPVRPEWRIRPGRAWTSDLQKLGNNNRVLFKPPSCADLSCGERIPAGTVLRVASRKGPSADHTEN